MLVQSLQIKFHIILDYMSGNYSKSMGIIDTSMGIIDTSMGIIDTNSDEITGIVNLLKSSFSKEADELISGHKKQLSMNYLYHYQSFLTNHLNWNNSQINNK